MSGERCSSCGRPATHRYKWGEETFFACDRHHDAARGTAGRLGVEFLSEPMIAEPEPIDDAPPSVVPRFPYARKVGDT